MIGELCKCRHRLKPYLLFTSINLFFECTYLSKEIACFCHPLSARMMRVVFYCHHIFTFRICSVFAAAYPCTLTLSFVSVTGCYTMYQMSLCELRTISGCFMSINNVWGPFLTHYIIIYVDIS